MGPFYGGDDPVEKGAMDVVDRAVFGAGIVVFWIGVHTPFLMGHRGDYLRLLAGRVCFSGGEWSRSLVLLVTNVVTNMVSKSAIIRTTTVRRRAIGCN